jgi:hypothetical protein
MLRLLLPVLLCCVLLLLVLTLLPSLGNPPGTDHREQSQRNHSWFRFRVSALCWLPEVGGFSDLLSTEFDHSAVRAFNPGDDYVSCVCE